MEYKPVLTSKDLASLDDDQVLDGYLSVIRGNYATPGSDKTRSYWHGWRNGMADKGKIPVDQSVRQLAADAHDDCVATMVLLELVIGDPVVH
jgi:hypothetical protein